MNPAEFGKLATRHNLVEIAEAFRREANLSKLDGRNPASVQPVEVASWREADVGTVDGIRNCYGNCYGCWLVRSCRSTTLSTGDELSEIQLQSNLWKR